MAGCLLGVEEHDINHDLLSLQGLAVGIGERLHRRRDREPSRLGRSVGPQFSARVRGWLWRTVIWGHLSRISFDHSMQPIAETLYRIDAALVTDEARDMSVIPPHEKRAFAGFRDNAVPCAAALVRGVSYALECDALRGANRQHDR